MRTELNGTLEIDHKSGTVYFHGENGMTVLRLSKLPAIPALNEIATRQLDVNFEEGRVPRRVSWNSPLPSVANSGENEAG